MPVAVPEQLYRDNGQSLSGLPIWLEKIFIRLSYWAASRVVTCHAFGAFVQIFNDYPYSRRKLLVVDTVPDALPSEAFFRQVATMPAHRAGSGNPFRLIYVGRLHDEKLVDDLIRVMARLPRGSERRFVLRLVGDGPARNWLEMLTTRLDVADAIEFMGYQPSERVAEELAEADAFLSPLTGTSLREAALLGLPVVAYERDWVVGLLQHEKNAILVRSRDIDGMAQGVLRLAEDEDLRRRLSENIHALARRLWTADGLRDSLSRIHDAVR